MTTNTELKEILLRVEKHIKEIKRDSTYAIFIAVIAFGAFVSVITFDDWRLYDRPHDLFFSIAATALVGIMLIIIFIYSIKTKNID